jgi:hypothetical protein
MEWIIQGTYTMNNISNREKLLRFLEGWRDRLSARGAQNLSPEELGQLLTLNTIIYYITVEC